MFGEPDSHCLSLLQELVGIWNCIKVLGYYGIDYRPVLGEPCLDG